MGTSRGREIMRWRLSSAAGIHRSTKTRTEIERDALREEEMSILDGDYLRTAALDEAWWDEVEPTVDELDGIENEEYVPEDPDDEVYNPFDEEYERNNEEYERY